MQTKSRFVAIDDVRPGMVLADAAYAQKRGKFGLKFPPGLVLSPESVDQLKAHQAEFVEIEEPDPRSPEERERDTAQAHTYLSALFSRLDMGHPLVGGLFQQLVAYRSGL